MTVHKQGSLEVKCERVFYERKQAGGKRLSGQESLLRARLSLGASCGHVGPQLTQC
ncbi:hypothetical protein PtB15_13B180 [Puccinia triticina]|nr:hypothetical protein PtB15_13B180 [Puccinia triticina]